MYTNVFISRNNEVNFQGIGRMVNLRDLNEDVCIGNKSLKGLLQTTEGVYLWHENIDRKEEVEDVGEICEYVKISEERNILYSSLMEDISEDMEIIKCNLEKYCLTAVVQHINKQWIYIHNVWIDSDGIIQNNKTMIYKNVLLDSLKLAV